MASLHQRHQAFGDAVRHLAQCVFGLLYRRGLLAHRVGDGDRPNAEDDDAADRCQQAMPDVLEVNHAALPGGAAPTRLRPACLAS